MKSAMFLCWLLILAHAQSGDSLGGCGFCIGHGKRRRDYSPPVPRRKHLQGAKLDARLDGRLDGRLQYSKDVIDILRIVKDVREQTRNLNTKFKLIIEKEKKNL